MNGGYIYLTNALIHSAKGTTWENVKYIEKTPDGKYIYPDDYEGGRHADTGKKASTKSKSEEKTDPDAPDQDEQIQLLGSRVPSSWMETLKNHTDKIIQQHADMFKDSKTVVEHLLRDENRQAFRNTLQALTGADPSRLSDALVDKMRRQLARQYGVVTTNTNTNKLETSISKKQSNVERPQINAKSKASNTTESSKSSSSNKKTLDYDRIHKVNGGKNGRRRS